MDIVSTRAVHTSGNTTTYEWRTGRVPDVIQELRPSSPVVVETAAEDQIDFGDVDEATSVGTSQSNGDFVHLEHEEIDFEDVDDNISWNISVQDDGSGNVDSIGASLCVRFTSGKPHPRQLEEGR